MFKNALLFRIGSWEPPALAEIEDQLGKARFSACGATQEESAGWVEPRGERHGPLAEAVGGQLILRLATERKAVPGSVVKSELEERLDRIEQETGSRPKGKRAKELKEEIVHELLPRAFPKRSGITVWLNPSAQLLVVGTSSAKATDRLTTMLAEILGPGVTLTQLQTNIAPATAMAQWLREKEAPPGFTIDRECELKQPDSEKATVRYARHTLDIDEVAEHIVQGKLPTQLAMTWNDRVSFVLAESGALKKIKLLDVALEGPGAIAQGEDGGFDADVVITTGELSQLIPDLLDALGGELVRDMGAPATAAPTAG